MSNSLIHIGFAINNTYAKYMATTMASILDHLAKERSIYFHVITSDLSSENKRRIENLQHIHPFSIEYIPANIQQAKLIPPNKNHHVSAETNFRLEIASLKPELDKILFLDVDLVCNTDISQYWDLDISEYCAACVPDAPNYKNSNQEFQQKTGLKEYYNTGVCLMNLDKCRKNNIEDRIKQAIQQYGPFLRFPDQDLLNIAFQDHVLPLPHSWNVMVLAIDWFYPANIIKEVQQNPLILHWAGTEKPWQKPHIRYADLFWKYNLATPFFADTIFANTAGVCSLRKSSLQNAYVSASLLKTCMSFPKIRREYYIYKILSKITWGKSRSLCKQKRDFLHEKIRTVRSFFRN